MNLDLILILIIFITYFFFFKKFGYLNEDKNLSEHKKLVANDKIPILMGGLFLVTVLIIFSSLDFFPIKFSLILIFLLGLSSDKNVLPSPKIRLYIQLLLLLYIVFDLKLEIQDLRLEALNFILSNSLLNIIFTIFCLAIFINGSNFIDGLNGLLIGYSILIFSSIILVILNFEVVPIFDERFIVNLMFSLMLLFIFNISGFVYLGDNGSYLLSLFLGIYLILFFMNNQFLSPYYIASLLWYPAFENFFSFLRRLKSNKNISLADNLHLHQLFYKYLIHTKLIKNKNLINSFSSILILFLNTPGFIFCSMYPYDTKIQIIIIITNLIFYIYFYLYLSKKFDYKQF